MLGMYPGDPGMPGGDFAGIVARVPPGGAGAGGLQPGDAVFGLAAGSLGSYVHASAQTLVPMPASVRQAWGWCWLAGCTTVMLPPALNQLTTSPASCPLPPVLLQL